MQKVVFLKSEDMPLWDAFVKNHPHGWICHLSGWKDVIEKSFKHIRGYFLAVWDDEVKAITAGLPVYSVKSWLTGNRLVSIPFAQLCDPLVSFPEEIDLFIPPLLDLYRQNRCSHIEIRATFSDTLKKITEFETSVSHKHHYVALHRGIDEIKKTFHATKVSQPIAKALKYELKLKLGESENDLSEFYKLLFNSRKRLGLPPIPYCFFKSLWEKFGTEENLSVLFALYEDKPVAATLIFKFGNKVSSEFLADNIAFRRLHPNHFLYWESMKTACIEGYDIFSFGRTHYDNKSLLAFKNSWGTIVTDLNMFFYPKEAAGKYGNRDSSWKYKLIKKSSLHAPDFIFRAIGSFCYRHLG